MNGKWKKVKRLPFYKSGKKISFTIVGHEFVSLLRELKKLRNNNLNLERKINEQQDAIWKYHEALFPNKKKPDTDTSGFKVRTNGE